MIKNLIFNIKKNIIEYNIIKEHKYTIYNKINPIKTTQYFYIK